MENDIILEDIFEFEKKYVWFPINYFDFTFEISYKRKYKLTKNGFVFVECNIEYTIEEMKFYNRLTLYNYLDEFEEKLLYFCESNKIKNENKK